MIMPERQSAMLKHATLRPRHAATTLRYAVAAMRVCRATMLLRAAYTLRYAAGMFSGAMPYARSHVMSHTAALRQGTMAGAARCRHAGYAIYIRPLYATLRHAICFAMLCRH